MATEGERDDQRSRVLNVVKGHFRPEFINRLDEVVVFDAFTEDELHQILEMEVRKLEARIKNLELHVEVTRAAAQKLTQLGSSHESGARALRRTLEEQVQDKIADLVLDKMVDKGNTLLVDLDDDAITVSVVVEDRVAR